MPKKTTPSVCRQEDLSKDREVIWNKTKGTLAIEHGDSYVILTRGETRRLFVFLKGLYRD